MTIKDIRPALRAWLLDDADLSAAVGGRVYPGVLPQGQRDPSIVFNRITGQGDWTMEGASGLTRPRFQIDAWAQTIDAATALADLVKARIDGYRGPMTFGGSPGTTVEVQGVFFDNERDLYDFEAKLHWVSRDYYIWFAER